MKPIGKYLSAFFIAFSLLSVAGCGSMHRHQETGAYMDDRTLSIKVKEAIFDDPTLKVFEINVTTYQGVVQLSGFVRSRTDANRAMTVARNVRGVTNVVDDMQIK
ncbi:BON domain-containing protein [Leeia oryzae]|uniref:BON domain-containing protein n=1 Tax=Leeia oryzae TaxID=356662 RepID=UPI000362D253|nr:BON domain-containing protein [Leeia oryzae]